MDPIWLWYFHRKEFHRAFTSIFLSMVYDRTRRASEFDFNAELSGAANNTFKTDKAVSSSTCCFWFSD